MKISAYKCNDPVVKTLEKINALFIIFDGMLQIQLLSTSNCFVLERLGTGSSYGMYSVLMYSERTIGTSRFKLVTERYSWVARIAPSLLQSLMERFPKYRKSLNNAV